MSSSDVRAAERLIREYSGSLEFRLDFQDFPHEISDLRAAYGPPKGALLLARVDGETAGCVALRSRSSVVCEMKRLFVRPRFRGVGVGERLVRGILAAGVRLGYRAMLLDTVPSMDAAIRLYRRYGFVPTAPYRFNPIPGALYLRRSLRAAPRRSGEACPPKRPGGARQRSDAGRAARRG